MQKHALLIGVNQYGKDSQLVNLNYAEADATALGEVLQEQFEFKVRTLLGSQATRSEIFRQINSLTQVIGYNKDEIILFFFAGHGQSIHRRYILHPYGANANDEIESIAFVDLLNMFKTRFSKGQILCVIDACHSVLSVGATRGKNPLPDLSRDIKFLKQQSDSDKVVKSLLSCIEGEVSWESEEYEHGVFTKYLIDVLKEQCSERAFDDAIRDLGQFVPQYVKRKYGVTQTPWFESPLTSKTWLIRRITSNSTKIQTIEKNLDLSDVEKYSIYDLQNSGVIEEYLENGGNLYGELWFDFYMKISKNFKIQNIQHLNEIAKEIKKNSKGFYSYQKLNTVNHTSDSNFVENKNTEIAIRASTMVKVVGGEFEMGGCYHNPLHKVQLGDFYIDKYPVTNSQYALFLNLYKNEIVKSGDFAGELLIPLYLNKKREWTIIYQNEEWLPSESYENHPVTNVSWFAANEYAQFFQKRLPTEAEWEYAARGGQQTNGYEYSGSNKLDEVGWFRHYDVNRTTEPVGKKLSNELDLYDMSGHVREWCSDWFDERYYEQSPKNNPKGPESGKCRVLRGGSWDKPDTHCSVNYRTREEPDRYGFDIGFRCVKDL